jgi:Ca2+-binding RTX toxin-like protein
VTIDLLTNAASGGDAAGDTFSGVRDVSGSIHNDSLIGNSGFNRLEGGGGDDTIFGGDGDDTIILYATQQLTPGAALSNSSYVDAGAGNDTINQGTEDTGSLIYGGDGNDTVRLWNGVAYGGAGNDAFVAPGQATMFGESGSDTFTFQGTGNVAYGGEDGDFYNGSQLGISFVSDAGATGIDVVVLAHAATSSSLYWWLDAATDTMYFTTQSDVTDGAIDSGVAVVGWTSSRIERLMANDGSFVSF